MGQDLCVPASRAKKRVISSRRSTSRVPFTVVRIPTIHQRPSIEALDSTYDLSGSSKGTSFSSCSSASSSVSNNCGRSTSTTAPVPILRKPRATPVVPQSYCRALLKEETSMKGWATTRYSFPNAVRPPIQVYQVCIPPVPPCEFF